jgi:hypothetical protein
MGLARVGGGGGGGGNGDFKVFGVVEVEEEVVMGREAGGPSE